MSYELKIEWSDWVKENENCLIDYYDLYCNGVLIQEQLVPYVCFPFRVKVHESFFTHHALEFYDIAGKLLCKDEY